MRVLKAISARFALAMIMRERSGGDLISIRTRLDDFLDNHADDFAFMLAFDAALMFAEGRNDGAKKRLSDCLKATPDDGSPDAQYVRLFCRFFEGLHDPEERKAARKAASQLEVDPLIKAFLKFPSEDSVVDITREERERRKSPAVSFEF